MKNYPNTQFKILRWQLLGSYLCVMIGILVISEVLVYHFFAASLYKQLDRRLLNLANAAAHSLTILKRDRTLTNHPKYRFDKDGDLDIPWQNLRQNTQSIEWFNQHQQLLAQSGAAVPNFPIKEGFYTWGQDKKRRTLTITAYSYVNNQKILEGFIRSSESCQEIETILQQLLWGFYGGGLVALGLIGIGGMGLTRQALKPIEESYQQLTQFTADASHELRSPLAVIKTSLEVIKSHPERIHPADYDKIEAILSATNQMNRLVEDLLWLARIDAQLNILLKEKVLIPLDELLEDIIDFIEFKAEKKDIILKFYPKNSVVIQGEPSQLGRLFTNLLDNAIKYTPQGGYINVSLTENEQWAVIKIEDTGIGLKNEDLTRIFNRFWRAETARNYQEGTGLGLAIALAIIKAHQGEIKVTSSLDIGTCFTIYLPMHK